MRLIDDQDCPGPTNMARDEALLECSTETTLRLYGWQPPCLSLGLFQNYAQVRQNAPSQVPMVRRITGGGTIYHIHEVTYSIVGQLGQDNFPSRLRDAYPLLHGAILKQLQLHGAALMPQAETVGDRRYHQEVRCFASPAADDLVSSSGAKALGSAGRNRDGRFLIHGSLKLASNDWDEHVVIGCGVDAATARNCLRDAFAAITGQTFQTAAFTEIEQQRSREIEALRYGDGRWLEERKGPRP